MPAKLTAVLGACKRRGRWQVSSQTKAFVLFGHCYIDYREAYADDELEKMKLSVLCILGNATFIVPEGSDIQPSVVSLLASTAFDVPVVETKSPLPPLAIESTTLLGRCRVVTISAEEAAAEKDADLVGTGAQGSQLDRIGPPEREPTQEDTVIEEELPPLQAVAKALLAEPKAVVDPPTVPHTEVTAPAGIMPPDTAAA